MSGRQHDAASGGVEGQRGMVIARSSVSQTPSGAPTTAPVAHQQSVLHTHECPLLGSPLLAEIG